MEKYQVFIKAAKPGLEAEWLTCFLVDSEEEMTAIRQAKERFAQCEDFSGYEVEEIRTKILEPGERPKFCKTIEQFELEDYEKNALGKIVRALERIAGKDFSVRYEPTPIEQNSGVTPFLIFSSVCSLLTVIILILSKLLFR